MASAYQLRDASLHARMSWTERGRRLLSMQRARMTLRQRVAVWLEYTTAHLLRRSLSRVYQCSTTGFCASSAYCSKVSSTSSCVGVLSCQAEICC